MTFMKKIFLYTQNFKKKIFQTLVSRFMNFGSGFSQTIDEEISKTNWKFAFHSFIF